MIRFRRGLDARSIPAVKFRIPDLMVVAGRVMEQVNARSPDAVFVDGTGIGWGVVDRLSQLGCSIVRGVDFGSSADCTDDMRKRGLASPDDGDALALTFAYPVERRN